MKTPTTIQYRHEGVPVALTCDAPGCCELATYRSEDGYRVHCEACSEPGRAPRYDEPVTASFVRQLLRTELRNRRRYGRRDCWLLIGWLRGEAA